MATKSVQNVVEHVEREDVVETYESDDDLIREWQEMLMEAREKLAAYSSDPELARQCRSDRKAARKLLISLPKKIAERRQEIAFDEWRSTQLSHLQQIEVVSKDRGFSSISRENLERLSPDLVRMLDGKFRWWETLEVWNFKRHRLGRFKALPTESLSKIKGSLRHFHRLEIWQAVGTADPWLVGVVKSPLGHECFYRLYDWGVESSLDRKELT